MVRRRSQWDIMVLDADGDGFSSHRFNSCTRDVGYVDNSDDCDDTRAAVNPDAKVV